MSNSPGRIETIDVMRVFAMLAVISIHTASYQGANAVGQRLDGATIVNQFARCAVPFFFVISGYLWAARCKLESDYWRLAVAISRRALLIFFAWSLFYAIRPSLAALWRQGIHGSATMLVQAMSPFDAATFANLLLEGTRVHLWFLPALALAALISGALLARGREVTLFILAIVLFVVGLAGTTYADAPFGFVSHFNFRNGPFFSLIMFSSGYAVQRYGNRLKTLSAGVGMAVAGFLLQLSEISWIHHEWGSTLTHDYSIGTYFFGMGVALIALSNPTSLRMTAIASIGPLMLGVYVSHFFFVELLRPVDRVWHGAILWDITYVAIAFALSLTLSFALARWPRTRRFVT